MVGKFFVDDPGSVEPWQTLLNDNTAAGTRIDSPVLITQGDADTTVIPATTAKLTQAYCAKTTNATEKITRGSPTASSATSQPRTWPRGWRRSWPASLRRRAAASADRHPERFRSGLRRSRGGV